MIMNRESEPKLESESQKNIDKVAEKLAEILIMQVQLRKGRVSNKILEKTLKDKNGNPFQ